jgi:4-hydroxy-tetrahydrodipicolinate synthase
MSTEIKGIMPALVTPLEKDGVSLNENALKKLISYHKSQKADGFYIAGATGEGLVLSLETKKKLFEKSIEAIGNDALKIVHVADMNFENTKYLAKYAQDCGADAILVVTPYYNKASIKGLIEHYKGVAEATSLPIILYNVPSRTGLDMGTPTLEGLYDVKNIVAVKEASGNVVRAERILKEFGDRYMVYSGCDELILPILSLGGKGVISAVSNIVPREISTLCGEFFNGNIKESQKIQLSLYDLIEEMFQEVNPIPVKSAMAHMGFCENYLRLPLVKMSEGKEKVLLSLMKEQGLI